MLFQNFNNFYIILPNILLFSLSWVVFFKINNSSFYKNTYKGVNKNVNLIKRQHFFLLIKLNYLVIFLLILFFMTLHGSCNSFWWNHLAINNLNTFMMFLSYVFSFILVYFLRSNSSNKINYNNDFFFSILNISNFLPLIFFSNNMFSFIFLLELNSCLVFYKLIVSKLWYKSNDINQLNIKKILPKGYVNLIFFQYWITFFSSIFLFFSYINIAFLLGTSDWDLLNFLIITENNINYFNNNILFVFIVFTFFFGLILKTGLTPFHLFKIEVYKNIPFLSILFYTTYYFFSFFLFFIYFLIKLGFYLFIYWWLFFTIILLVGSLYVISLLFDVNFLKAFFAYSTVVNTLNFFVVLVATMV